MSQADSGGRASVHSRLTAAQRQLDGVHCRQSSFRPKAEDIAMPSAEPIPIPMVALSISTPIATLMAKPVPTLRTFFMRIVYLWASRRLRLGSPTVCVRGCFSRSGRLSSPALSDKHLLHDEMPAQSSAQLPYGRPLLVLGAGQRLRPDGP